MRVSPLFALIPMVAAYPALGLTAADGETVSTEKLLLRVTPIVSTAPSSLIVKATIAKDPANRWLAITADSGSFYRSSAIQLDGDKAPTVMVFRLSNLPSGEYGISAVLGNSLGEQTIVLQTVVVLSRFGAASRQTLPPGTS